MNRRLFVRFALSVFLSLFVSALALAQYGGGGGGMGSTGTSTSTGRSYGSSGAAIGAGVGAAAGIGAAYLLLRNRGTIVGCVEPSSAGKMKLMNEKDKNTYALLASNDVILAPGERVALKGKKTKDSSSGEPVFQVEKLAKDYGSCKQ
jgi:hypothetical protein